MWFTLSAIIFFNAKLDLCSYYALNSSSGNKRETGQNLEDRVCKADQRTVSPLISDEHHLLNLQPALYTHLLKHMPFPSRNRNRLRKPFTMRSTTVRLPASSSSIAYTSLIASSMTSHRNSRRSSKNLSILVSLISKNPGLMVTSPYMRTPTMRPTMSRRWRLTERTGN